MALEAAITKTHVASASGALASVVDSPGQVDAGLASEGARLRTSKQRFVAPRVRAKIEMQNLCIY